MGPPLSTDGPARRPIRVVLVFYRDDASVGESLRVGEAIATGSDPGDVDLHLVFAYGAAGPVASHSKWPCHFLGASGHKDFRKWREVRRLMRELKPDLVHFVDVVIWIYLALTWAGHPRLTHWHGKALPRMHKGWRRALLLTRLIGRSASASAFISESNRQNFLERGYAYPDRAFTVYNSVDTQSLSHLPARDAARRDLGLPAEAKILGMFCRLVRWKGCSEGLDLLQQLPAEWHIAFAGDGPLRQELEEKATACGVRDRVHFCGSVSDMRVAYAAIDAYLFLSYYEPFDLVLMEAMAAGVPIFGVRAPGEHPDPGYPLYTGDNAILILRSNPEFFSPPQPADLAELVPKIREFGEDPTQFAPMVERARDWVTRRFDVRVQAHAMLDVYRRVLEQH